MAIQIKLNPKQKEFHDFQCYDAEGNPELTWCYYGGAMGGAKTHGIGASALLSALEEPGSRIAVVRLKETDLKNTTLKTFVDKVCPVGGELWRFCQMEWNRSDNIFVVRRASADGVPPSEIHFFGLMTSGGTTTDAYGKLLSSEYNKVFIDEAYEVPEDVMSVLPTRVRHSRPGRKYKLAIKVASNPAPTWIYEWFIEKPIKNSKFIPSLFTDNLENLPKSYADAFERMTPAMQKRFRDGDHNCFEGQVWPGGVKRHHLLDPFYVEDLRPDEWKFLQTVDPGLNDPTASLWGVYNIEEDCLIALKEYEVEESDVSDHAARFKLTEAMLPFRYHVTRKIDPAACQRSLASSDTATNVLRLFKRHGLYYTPANNSTELKTISMWERLQVSATRRHPMTGELGCPGILFVEPTTERTRRAISGMMWEETKSEKPRWKNVNKHLVDCATYMTAHLSKSAKREEDDYGDS